MEYTPQEIEQRLKQLEEERKALLEEKRRINSLEGKIIRVKTDRQGTFIVKVEAEEYPNPWAVRLYGRTINLADTITIMPHASYIFSKKFVEILSEEQYDNIVNEINAVL